MTGYTGTGKLELMRAESQTIANKRGWKIYHKGDNPWWQEYEGQEIAVFNEFDGNYPYTKFKELVDADTVTLECKHGSCSSNLRLIFICSNWDTDDWYKGHPKREAAMRRVRSTWQIQSNSDQIAVGKQIIKKVMYDLYLQHQGLLEPPAFRKNMHDAFKATLDTELDNYSTQSADFQAEWEGSTVSETPSAAASSAAAPAGHAMLYSSASMGSSEVVMPLLSDTSAQFSFNSQCEEPVPLTTGAVMVHNVENVSESRKRGSYESPSSSDEMIVCLSGSSPVTRMIAEKENRCKQHSSNTRAKSGVPPSTHPKLDLPPLSKSVVDGSPDTPPVQSTSTFSRTWSQTSAPFSKSFKGNSCPFANTVSRSHKESRPSSTPQRTPPARAPLSKSFKENSCPFANTVSRSHKESRPSSTPQRTPPARVPVTKRHITKVFRMTDNVVRQIRANLSLAFWIHRSKSRYYLIFDDIPVLMLFISTN